MFAVCLFVRCEEGTVFFQESFLPPGLDLKIPRDLIFMEIVLYQRHLYEIEMEFFRYPDPHIVVQRIGNMLVEETGPAKAFFPQEDRRRGAYEIVKGHVPVNIPSFSGDPLPQGYALGHVDDHKARINRPYNRRAVPYQIELQSKFFRQPLVIVVQECNELSPGMADPGISRCRLAPVCKVSYAFDSLVPEEGQDFLGCIFRSIIYNDQFKILESLIHHAGHGSRKQFRPVTGRNDHGYCRLDQNSVLCLILYLIHFRKTHALFAQR